MSDEPPQHAEGDRVTVEGEVVKLQPNGTLIVKLVSGSHVVLKPEQVTKKP